MSPSNSLIIASLGSSFAAGPGLPKDRNYPSLVAERLGARLVDVSSTGATLDNITRTSQKVDENLLPPQISKVPSNADVVTLTAGGNDIEYSRSMIIDSIKVSKPGFKGPDLNKRLSFSQLKNRFEETLREIHTAAAGAQIYLVQYLSVFGSATISGRDTPLSAESIAHFQEQGQLIDRAMSEAAASFPYARVVEIAKVSRGSALGTTTDPVVSGFLTKEQCKDGAMPYHPTEAGMEMVAEVLSSQILKDRFLIKRDQASQAVSAEAAGWIKQSMSIEDLQSGGLIRSLCQTVLNRLALILWHVLADLSWWTFRR